MILLDFGVGCEGIKLVETQISNQSLTTLYCLFLFEKLVEDTCSTLTTIEK